MFNYHSFIGSKLFAHLFPDNPKIQKRCSGNKDVDILLFRDPGGAAPSIKEYYKGLFGNKIELHYIPLISDYFKTLVPGLPKIADHDDPYRTTLRNMFFTLKASHLPWDTVHKNKTIYDLFLMSEENCKIDETLLHKLLNYWEQTKGSKWRADFTKESADFFDDAVSRENIHDELHERVKHFDKPAFKYLQEPDQTTVWVCPEKFKAASEDLRRYVVIEEAQTLALERLLIPGIKTVPFLAYSEFIGALCQRLAPIWMVPYIIENLKYFLTYKENFYDTKIRKF